MTPHRQAGFTLLELIVVVVLVVLFFAVALDNLLPLRGAAERAQVMHTEGVLRSALGLQAAERVLGKGTRGLRELTRENPLDWLAIKPATSKSGTLEGMTAGSWAWLSQSNTLAYRLRYPEYVEGVYAGEWLRYRVVLSGRDSRPTNLALIALDSPRWDLPPPEALVPTTKPAEEENDDDGTDQPVD